MKPLLLLLLFSVACSRPRTSTLDLAACLDVAVPRTLERLWQLGVDSVMTFHYDYDSGSLPDVVTYVVWQQAGHRHIQAFRGCDTLSLPTAHTRSADTLFTFYQQQRLDTMSAQIPNTYHALRMACATRLPCTCLRDANTTLCATTSGNGYCPKRRCQENCLPCPRRTRAVAGSTS